MLKLAGVFAVASILSAASSVAYAEEQPELITPPSGISIGVGRAEMLRFKSNFSTIILSNQGVVQATAQSDRVLTLFGQAEGAAILTILAADGSQLYSVGVTVTPEAGGVVRVYGLFGDPKENKDYIGFYCTSVACGRADKELMGARDVTSKSFTVTNPAGRSTTTTSTFGR